MKQINKITIVFENCESITFPAKVFYQCYLGKISTEIQRIAINAIEKMTFADEIALGIFFPEAEKLCEKNEMFEENVKVFDRLTRYMDITYISLLYDDETEETYFIPYEEESSRLGAPNFNQKYWVSDCGDLYIVIAKDKDICDFFDIDVCNDNERIEQIKNLYECEE